MSISKVVACDQLEFQKCKSHHVQFGPCPTPPWVRARASEWDFSLLFFVCVKMWRKEFVLAWCSNSTIVNMINGVWLLGTIPHSQKLSPLYPPYLPMICTTASLSQLHLILHSLVAMVPTDTTLPGTHCTCNHWLPWSHVVHYSLWCTCTLLTENLLFDELH